jgi:hypothetical protein
VTEEETAVHLGVMCGAPSNDRDDIVELDIADTNALSDVDAFE